MLLIIIDILYQQLQIEALPKDVEQDLPEDLRWLGSHVLLFHDILEDTYAELPPGTPDDVTRLVDELTVKDGEDTTQVIWSKSREAILFKLYDQTYNLLEPSPGKKSSRYYFVKQLIVFVRANYGELNIVQLAEGILAKRSAA